MGGVVLWSDFLQHVFALYGHKFAQRGIAAPDGLSPEFDLIRNAIVDSLEYFSLVGSLEERFGALDMELVSEHGFGALGSLYQGLTGAGPGRQAGITRADMAEALAGLGLEPGGVFVIHSGLQHLGPIQGHAEALHAALQDVAGSGITVMVPAANIPQFKAHAFDARTTPADASLGVFSEYIRSRPGALRSENPLDSAAALGPQAAALIRPYELAYGEGSPWRQALDLDATALFVGVGLEYASAVHVAELDCRVPYRAMKDFRYRTMGDSGPRESCYRLFARQPETLYDFARIHAVAGFGAACTRQKLGYGVLTKVRMRAIYASAVRALTENPRFFLEG